VRQAASKEGPSNDHLQRAAAEFINIEFEGVCTILMGYLLDGEPAIGDRVAPIFATESPTYTILDLAWLPEGTPESDLPEGFRFSR